MMIAEPLPPTDPRYTPAAKRLRVLLDGLLYAERRVPALSAEQFQRIQHKLNAEIVEHVQRFDMPRCYFYREHIVEICDDPCLVRLLWIDLLDA